LINGYVYAPRYQSTGVTTGFSSVESTTLNVTSTAGIVVGSLVSNPAYVSGQTVTDIVDAVSVVTSAAPDSQPSGTITFLPYTYSTLVTFAADIPSTSRLSVAALGVGDPVTYSWSTPVTENYTAGNVLVFPLTPAQTQGTNSVNLIVDVNGIRARPPEGVEYLSDGSTVTYTLPLRGGYLTGGFTLGNVVTSNISVFIDNDPLPNTDWSLDTYVANSQTRSITLDTAAPDNSTVLISVDYAADYVVTPSQLIWKTSDPNVAAPSITVVPSAGDTVSITSFNDTAQQDLLTQVFKGPTTDGEFVGEGFDFGTANAAPGSYDFAGIYVNTGSNVVLGASRLCEDVVYTIITAGNTDFTLYGASSNVALTTFTSTVTADGNVAIFGTGTVTTNLTERSSASDVFNGQPDSFDFSNTVPVQTNRFDTGRQITDPARLTITLDSRYLASGVDYTVDGSNVIITGAAIAQNEVVAITSVTQSQVPGSIGFRIFQDMRGQQFSYRITPETSTKLAQSLTSTADIIYVEDASKLSEPNLALGILGQITINGERILYRARNVVANTVSGLRRGTAGTAADSHAVGAPVYDIGIGNLLPAEYQDLYVIDNALGDGSTTVFSAPTIMIDDSDSAEIQDAVLVYVGGILQTSGYTISNYNPITVTFAEAPADGYQVSIRVRQGQDWYDAIGDGIPLQEQQTRAARFIRGD